MAVRVARLLGPGTCQDPDGLANLARRGMAGAGTEILDILQAKLG